MNDIIPIDQTFNQRMQLPDSHADGRLSRLVGMDVPINQLSKILGMLIFPHRLDSWRKKYHPNASAIFEYFSNRHPLVIIAGDVGTGKTELAETIGSRVARAEKREITLFPMSLSTRGSGLVGEMTKLISSAFCHVEESAGQISKSDEGFSSGIIMLIDEADALAQSRENQQMHHEDRAGVNALIRGIDSLNRQLLPVSVIMCTNRLSALDPAIKRRAAEIFQFERPDDKKRELILRPALQEIDFTDEQIKEIIEITGEHNGRGYGYTFSDITQRLFHAIIMSAYPDQKIDYEQAIEAVKKIEPTPPFKDV